MPDTTGTSVPSSLHQYANDLAGRLVVTPRMRVLEAACGTGLLTPTGLR